MASSMPHLRIKNNINLGLKKLLKVANPEEGSKIEAKGIKKYQNQQNFINYLFNDESKWKRYVSVLTDQTTFDSKLLKQKYSSNNKINLQSVDHIFKSNIPHNLNIKRKNLDIKR